MKPDSPLRAYGDFETLEEARELFPNCVGPVRIDEHGQKFVLLAEESLG